MPRQRADCRRRPEPEELSALWLRQPMQHRKEASTPVNRAGAGCELLQHKARAAADFENFTACNLPAGKFYKIAQQPWINILQAFFCMLFEMTGALVFPVYLIHALMIPLMLRPCKSVSVCKIA